MTRLDLSRHMSEAPITVKAYVVLTISQSIIAAIFLGGLVLWFGVLVVVFFDYLLLRGTRVIWQIAVVLSIGNLLFAPVSHDPWWAIVLDVAGLALLLAPPTRRYFRREHA